MVLVDVLEEHLDEAEFRWLQWEKALGAPDFSLSEIARLEALLLAHLDGLVVGASTSVESVLRPAFATEDAFRICAAAFSLLALGEVDEVLLRFREAEPEERAAIRRVLELSEAPGLGTRLLDVLKREDTVPQAEVLEALAFRQEAPPPATRRTTARRVVCAGCASPLARTRALHGMICARRTHSREHQVAQDDGALVPSAQTVSV